MVEETQARQQSQYDEFHNQLFLICEKLQQVVKFEWCMRQQWSIITSSLTMRTTSEDAGYVVNTVLERRDGQ